MAEEVRVGDVAAVAKRVAISRGSGHRFVRCGWDLGNEAPMNSGQEPAAGSLIASAEDPLEEPGRGPVENGEEIRRDADEREDPRRTVCYLRCIHGGGQDGRPGNAC
ncbi:hypothetical protein B296_00047357 [Ensete ventricosum]|uniref:Uncharacterized protein n=1 Tax=Ensete ventricosum TaxID=4639 RepID=A0A426YQN7_ENSVE|nr:hypothetical protein B296_00047357 [Ensete ventricosum]